MVIYKITNTVNGKVYIGKTMNSPKTRWLSHLTRVRNKVHNNKHLAAAVEKYGTDNFTFEVILQNATNDDEIRLIAEYKSYDKRFGYNKTMGGEGVRANEETRKKISDTSKGRIPTQKTRKLMSLARLGMTFSDEHKQKIGEASAKRMKSAPIVECPICKHKGQHSPGMYRWHFNNCKKRNK